MLGIFGFGFDYFCLGDRKIKTSEILAKEEIKQDLDRHEQRKRKQTLENHTGSW